MFDCRNVSYSILMTSNEHNFCISEYDKNRYCKPVVNKKGLTKTTYGYGERMEAVLFVFFIMKNASKQKGTKNTFCFYIIVMWRGLKICVGGFVVISVRQINYCKIK